MASTVPQNVYVILLRNTPTGAYAAPLLRFLNHTQRHTQPVGLLWTGDQPVAEAATYTTHNKHNGPTSVPLAGFEPAIPTIKRPQTYTLVRRATGIGQLLIYPKKLYSRQTGTN